MKSFGICLIAILSLGILPDAISAQQPSGSLTGVVTDPNEAVIAGASVTATNKSTNLERMVSTNSEGVFVISNLPVGDYEVQISAPGFQLLTLKAVRLNVGQT